MRACALGGPGAGSASEARAREGGRARRMAGRAGVVGEAAERGG